MGKKRSRRSRRTYRRGFSPAAAASLARTKRDGGRREWNNACLRDTGGGGERKMHREIGKDPGLGRRCDA